MHRPYFKSTWLAATLSILGVPAAASSQDAVFTRSDANADGEVNLSDAVFSLNFLFSGGKTPSCMRAADANDDGSVNISDASFTLGFLFLGTAPPPAPWPLCGNDTTPDNLSCAEFPRCSQESTGVKRPNVRVINNPPNDARDTRFVSVNVDDNTVIVRDPPGGQEANAGDVIAGLIPEDSPARQFGRGYMLKLLKLKAVDGDLKVFDTAPAVLSDVFEDLNFTKTLDLTEFRIEPEIGLGAPEAGGGGGLSDGVGLDFGNRDLYNGPIPGGDLLLRLKQANIHYSLKPTLHVDQRGLLGIPTEITWSLLQGFDTTLEVQVDTTANVDMTIGETKSLVALAECFTIQGVPICINAHVIISVGTQFVASGAMMADAGATFAATNTVGFKWTAPFDIVPFVQGGSPSFSLVPDPPVLQIGSAEATIQPYLRAAVSFSLGLGSIAGAGAGLTVGIDLPNKIRGQIPGVPPCVDWSMGIVFLGKIPLFLKMFGQTITDQEIVFYDPSEAKIPIEGTKCQFSRWESLGDTISGDPAIAQNLDGRLVAFARDAAGTLKIYMQDIPNSDEWSHGTLSDVITSNPAVGRNIDRRLEVFARGTDAALYHAFQISPDHWSGWSSLEGTITGDPAVGENADGRLEVFARGTDTSLRHRRQVSPGGAWSPWESREGGLTSNIAVGQNLDGRLEIFARGTDAALYHAWQVGPGNTDLSDWTSLGGVMTGDPAVSRNKDGRIEVFVRGTDDASVYHRSQVSPGGVWSDWASLGGNVTSNLSIAQNVDGRLEVFARRAGPALWHNRQISPNGADWSDWSSLEGSVTGTPAVGRNFDGRLEVFARGTDGALWHR